MKNVKNPVSFTISCGIYYALTSEDAKIVFDRADAAFYRAKREGLNRIFLFSRTEGKKIEN
jgi:PleD family two-component response regulator